MVSNVAGRRALGSRGQDFKLANVITINKRIGFTGQWVTIARFPARPRNLLKAVRQFRSATHKNRGNKGFQLHLKIDSRVISREAIAQMYDQSIAFCILADPCLYEFDEYAPST